MEIDRDNLHHAYLVLGDKEHSKALLLSFLEESGLLRKQSPDLFLFEGEAFGVKEARLLSRQAQGKALGERKIFIISPSKLSLESQNALLKTFEDPYPDTHFFIIIRDEEFVIPTLRSRMLPIRMSVQEDSVGHAKKFLSLSLSKRLDFAKVFADKGEDLPLFLDTLLLLLRGAEAPALQLRTVYDVRRFAGDTSASPRLILEHLALVL